MGRNASPKHLCIQDTDPVYYGVPPRYLPAECAHGTIRNHCTAILSPDEYVKMCNSMTVSNLIQELESRGVEMPREVAPRMLECLQFFITGNHTFSAAFAWATSSISTRLKNKNLGPGMFHPSLVHANSGELVDGASPEAAGCAKLTRDREGNQIITNPDRLLPRRLWDLCSNRIIPYSWVVKVTFDSRL